MTASTAHTAYPINKLYNSLWLVIMATCLSVKAIRKMAA